MAQNGLEHNLAILIVLALFCSPVVQFGPLLSQFIAMNETP